MKSQFDLKHNVAMLLPESLNDLWILSQIITQGCNVRAKTLRTIEIRRGERKEKVGKRAVILTIKAKKIQLNRVLRIGGEIIEGPEEISRGWHTLEIKPGTQLKVFKEWKSWEIEKIKSAAKPPTPIGVCILDEREADVWLITDKIKHIAHVRAPAIIKEKGIELKSEYFGQIIAVLQRLDVRHIIIAGPGFEHENLIKYIKQKYKEFKKEVYTDSLAHIGEPGLNELFKRKTLERIVKQSKLSQEVEIVEKFFEALAKDKDVVYGKDSVEKALQVGAVSRLLVSEEKVREYETLLELAEKTRAKILFVSTEHQAGQRLLAMGGIAAFLRFKL